VGEQHGEATVGAIEVGRHRAGGHGEPAGALCLREPDVTRQVHQLSVGGGEASQRSSGNADPCRVDVAFSRRSSQRSCKTDRMLPAGSLNQAM
jgi:hypothetical protein